MFLIWLTKKVNYDALQFAGTQRLLPLRFKAFRAPATLRQLPHSYLLHNVSKQASVSLGTDNQLKA